MLRIVPRPAAVLACGVLLVVAARADSWRDQAPNLFIQDRVGCDQSYIKSEVPFVNYVRLKDEADIHLTLTAEETAAGGTEYTLDFRGRGEFADIGFPLRFAVGADATEDETRERLVAAMRQGLAPFIARTPLADRLDVGFSTPSGAAAVLDPWRGWVFGVSVDGYASGEQAATNAYYSGEVEVRRVTELTEFELDGYVYVDHNRYELEDTVLSTTQRSYESELAYTHGLSDHFTLGTWLTYESSQYQNLHHSFTFTPGVEYSILSYSEYSRHEVYVRYRPAVLYRDYFEETLYEQEREALAKHALVVGVSLVREWGSVDLTATGSHYFHDFAFNRLTLNASGEFRLVGGLALNLSGSYSVIHDQLALRKGGVTEEERLLRLKELATGYSYWVSVGLSYTFGSVYSNIVNPRF